jgi:general stress protein 26
MASESTPAEKVGRLVELIRGIETAMLTTVQADGTLRSRPMQHQKVDPDGTLWYFTGAAAAKVDEIRQDGHVNASYADPAHSKYVSITGEATIVRDPAKAKELWNPLLKAWFPKGLGDPDLALLKVRADRAEYWDVTSSTMVQLFGMVKAIVTGKQYDPGENEKLDLRGARS